MKKKEEHASLVVVGAGIKFLSHLTVEAKAYIEQSEKLLYLVNEPAFQKWIEETHPHAESLDHLYLKYPLRAKAYQAIADYILDEVRKLQHVCVVLYGHPFVFAQPALNAVQRAKSEGFFTLALPGISAADCLFADLLINPGSSGCLSFDATDFLIHRRHIDTLSHLILWQISSIGILDHPKTSTNKKGILILFEYLSQFYDLSQIIYIYEAAQYPTLKPRIVKSTLKQLSKIKLSRISTLYIPPSQKAQIDKEMIKKLNIKTEELRQGFE